MKPGQDLLSISMLSRNDIDGILALATQYEKRGFPSKALKGKIVASLFFEASTRTRLSFETAALRLGAGVIGFSDPESTSFVQKGESFEDTIRMVDGYADCIVLRHSKEGSAERAAAIANHPVINAGDGAHEHPTQTLVDLYAMKSTQGSLDGLTVAMVGDLRYGRVPHSLAQALSLYPSTKQLWVSPKELTMPREVFEMVSERGVDVEETTSLEDALKVADILMMTRVQKERFEDESVYESLKDVYILQPELLQHAKSTMRILHPLPRRYEIPEEIDTLPQAYYMQQAAGAPFVRAALLATLFGKA